MALITPDLIAARRAQLAEEQDGFGVLLVEPLVAIAGGILGGALVTTGLWCATWKLLERKARRG